MGKCKKFLTNVWPQVFVILIGVIVAIIVFPSKTNAQEETLNTSKCVESTHRVTLGEKTIKTSYSNACKQSDGLWRMMNRVVDKDFCSRELCREFRHDGLIEGLDEVNLYGTIFYREDLTWEAIFIESSIEIEKCTKWYHKVGINGIAEEAYGTVCSTESQWKMANK